MKQNNFINNFKKHMKNFFKGFKNKNTSFFIIVLCICLISTALIWKYTSSNENISEEQGEQNSDIVKANEDPYKDYVDKTIKDYEKALEIEDKEEKLAKKNIVESFSKPIEGTISREFNINELVYYETVEEWRTHQGLDINPEGNLVVNAACDGTIEAVNKNSLMGVEIIINHGHDVKTKYCCLSSSSVSVGDDVKQGDKIGTLGIVENIEMSDGPHLHFEISIKDEIYDPTSLYTK
ncbi:M23 family metallopeptidase [Sedimentibacter sp. zth1]|uniref:M23 family metallopeptidase n=1 Tax=Sedimentibacter sp. zth1 TaxID=2816908 RepID=UPI001A938300|nr:M23 family metallopeptidase [Sedimentibacter sp. zth1]QSX05029.1 M23 family metallopeptidase [Sedimentibacter sp. zth1]